MQRVLIIDSYKNCVQIEKQIRKYLPEEKYDIEYGKSLKDSWNLLMTNPQRFNVCIADIGKTREKMHENINRLEYFLSLNSSIQVIFTADTMNITVELYRVPHIYFLKKPINDIRLSDAAAKLERRLEDINDNLVRKAVINTSSGDHIIKQDSIIYCSKAVRHTSVITEDRVYNHNGRLEDFIKMLGSTFCRVHCSTAVNFIHVVKVTKDTVYMDNGEALPISRRYQKTVKEFTQNLGIILEQKIEEKML